LLPSSKKIISSAKQEVNQTAVKMKNKLTQKYQKIIKGKAVPLHTMEALGGREGIAPTHSRPRH
jgi:hypothetical protein